MPEWLAEPGDYLAVLTMFSMVMGGLLWLIRTETRTVKKQLLPNSGKSVSDKVDLLVSRQADITAAMEELRRALADHNDKASAAHSRIHDRIDDHITNDHLRKRDDHA